MTVYIIRERGAAGALPVEVAHDATVDDLIAAAEASGLPARLQFVFGGQALNDRSARLCELGVCAEAEVTASEPSWFEDSDDFDIEESVATLKSGIDFGVICIAHKTNIGQETKMKLKIGEYSQVWLKSNDNEYKRTSFDKGELNIVINAKQQNEVNVDYEHFEFLVSFSQPDKFNKKFHDGINPGEFQICIGVYEGQDTSPPAAVVLLECQDVLG